jgi:WhiB family transcriptional regulator, redox-sensing transcriptional regulator
MTDNTGTEWRAEGACATAEPDLFFPIGTGVMGARQAERAIQICARCQVRRKCLEYAIDTRETHGIWGGTTPDERLRVHRSRLARQRADRADRADRAGREAPRHVA